MAFPWDVRVFPAFMGKIVSVYRNKKRPNISIVLENARIMIAFFVPRAQAVTDW
jgi:hypothetical protein